MGMTMAEHGLLLGRRGTGTYCMETNIGHLGTLVCGRLALLPKTGGQLEYRKCVKSEVGEGL